MRTFFSILFITLMTFGGCDIFSSSSKEKNFSNFTIETDQETYTSNQRVEVSLINNTQHSVLFSTCTTSLQHFKNDSWVEYDKLMCTSPFPQKPMEIKAGEEFSYKLIWFGNVDNEYEEGEYRLVFAITDKDEENLSFEKRTSVITVTN